MSTPLELSIKHWEELSMMENPTMDDIKGDKDALCRTHSLCRGCPVQQHTGYSLCHLTPYIDAFRALRRWLYAEGHLETFHHEARREVAFLRSLQQS